MDIAVIGAGHVGLVTGACLGAIGHHVRVLDVDIAKIDDLRAGRSTFYEPGLADLLAAVSAAGRISFHAGAEEAVPGARLVFLCVDTPNGPDGRVDLSSLSAAAGDVARTCDDDAVVVNRSTAPVGTATYLRSLMEEAGKRRFIVLVNPEFLAEGSAVRDFLAPDRLVVGADDPADAQPLVEMYEPILARRLPEETPADALTKAAEGPARVPVVLAGTPTAELIKYAANAFLAMKISFANEMAGIAEELGADVTQLSRAIGLDRRIGPSFLRAGIGWGGSCFPKDIVALKGMADTRGLAGRLLRAAHEVNEEQHRWVVRKLQQHLKTLVGRRVAFLGLTFKPDTDDLRNAPAIDIAMELARQEVRIRAFDPAVRQLPEGLAAVLELAGDPVEAARDAEAIVLLTEWPQFAALDLAALRGVMRGTLLVDGRNLFDPERARAAGFTYVGVGR
jgi:UDPglucose 6-dehydrogenase